MQVISFVSPSGGAGKTVMSVLTAGALAMRGHRLLFVDFDPSASATLYLLDGYVEDCDLKTLLRGLVDWKLGRTTRLTKAEECIRRHRVLGSERASFDLLPGGNLDDVRTEAQSLPRWGSLLEDLIRPLREKYDYAVVDCPNWLFPLFPMTVHLTSYYVVLTRPGESELLKTKTFLQRIFLMMKNQFDIEQPQLYTLVVFNQFRPGIHAEKLEKEAATLYRELAKLFPGIKTGHLEEKATYYSDEKETEFWGFKYLEDFRIDTYREKGHILTKGKGHAFLQFAAYLKTLEKLLEEAPYQFTHE